MKKVVVRFSDNDFNNAFHHALSLVSLAIRDSAEIRRSQSVPLTKSHIAWMINSLVPVCYVMFQNQWDYNGFNEVKPENTNDSEYYQRTVKYLTVKESNIFIDDEADGYLETLNGWDNSETYVMEFTGNPYTPTVYTV